jgi:hypothetical protein
LSKYSDIDLEKISYLIEVEGYNNNQLMEYLGVASTTFYRWRKEKREFRDTLKKSKIKLVAQIKDSLVKKTKGYHVDEWKEVIIDGQVVELKTRKYITPSDTAIIFALANLDPKNFKRQDKQVKEDIAKDEAIKHTKSKDEIRKRIENDDF